MIILAYQGWNRSLLAAEVPEPCIMHYFLGISICNSRYLVLLGAIASWSSRAVPASHE